MISNVAKPVRLALACTVADTALLWDAAADRAARQFAMAAEDVIDTLGPREDPEIEACVSMLFDHLVRPGGGFVSIEVTAMKAMTDAELAIAPAAPTVMRAAAPGNLMPFRAPRAA